MGPEREYPLQVQREGGVPIYRQLVNQIRQLVLSGYWPEGTKLPTERHLSSVLGISRNTVSLAYGELESSGILASFRGRGTFVVARTGRRSKASGAAKVRKLLERSVDEALLAGMGLEDFRQLANELSRERYQALAEVRVAFVECNREQLDYFSRELRLGAGIQVIPVLLEDLERGVVDAREPVSSADLIVTTFFHEERVKKVLAAWRLKVEVLSIALAPRIDIMVTIALVGRDKKVGLVCMTEAFAEKVKQSLEEAGMGFGLKTTIAKGLEELKEFLEGLDVVLASPGRRREAEALVAPGVQVIEFIYEPDAGSISLLKTVFLNKRRDRNRAMRPRPIQSLGRDA